MSVDLAAHKFEELGRWNAAKVVPSLIPTLDIVGHRLVNAKPRYQIVANKTHVPWPIIAVCHERESSQSWQASLAQGDPWNKVSIHVPRGRGPFQSWEDAAIDALANCGPYLARWEDWSIGGALCALNEYNGIGYWLHNIPSPYVWASTDQYRSGKYIADGHFDPNAVDHQLGCAALLLRMATIDNTVGGEFHPS